MKDFTNDSYTHTILPGSFTMKTFQMKVILKPNLNLLKKMIKKKLKLQLL